MAFKRSTVRSRSAPPVNFLQNKALVTSAALPISAPSRFGRLVGVWGLGAGCVLAHLMRPAPPNRWCSFQLQGLSPTEASADLLEDANRGGAWPGLRGKD